MYLTHSLTPKRETMGGTSKDNDDNADGKNGQRRHTLPIRYIVGRSLSRLTNIDTYKCCKVEKQL